MALSALAAGTWRLAERGWGAAGTLFGDALDLRLDAEIGAERWQAGTGRSLP
jgi:hypothetical protein